MFDPKLASIKIGDVQIVKGGLAVGEEAEKLAAEVLKGKLSYLDFQKKRNDAMKEPKSNG